MSHNNLLKNEKYFQSIGGTLYLNKTESDAYMDLFNRSVKSKSGKNTSHDTKSQKGALKELKVKEISMKNIPSSNPRPVKKVAKPNKMVMKILGLISESRDLLSFY